MQQYILCLLFITSVHTNTRTETVPAIPILTEQDSQSLQYLYFLDLGSTPVEKTENLNLDYYLCTLYDHIQILNHKIETKKSGWSSKSLMHGIGFLLFGGVCMGVGSLPSSRKRPGEDTFLIYSGYCMVALSLHFFYRTACYQQRLQQRLKRDKRIYRKLQAEYRLRNSSFSE
jgi:hypothetical protein